jgi:plastocyanin
MKTSSVFVIILALLAAGCAAHDSVISPTPVSATNSIASRTTGDATTDSGTGTLTVGIRLNGEAGIIDPRYGLILGYFKGKTSTTSQVVVLPMGRNVKFQNFDFFAEHTASFLGDATKNSAPWPSPFNGSGIPSPKGTAIGTAGFSTGVLRFGDRSKVYTTGAPGFYMFGCFFHYDSNGMRTVIIVR